MYVEWDGGRVNVMDEMVTVNECGGSVVFQWENGVNAMQAVVNLIKGTHVFEVFTKKERHCATYSLAVNGKEIAQTVISGFAHEALHQPRAVLLDPEPIKPVAKNSFLDDLRAL